MALAVSISVSLSLSLQPRAANAQAPADKATAQSLFDEAKALMGQKRYGDACPKLAESMRLDAGLGTLLNLCDCYEKNGQTASAWASFVEAAELAHRAGQADREQLARQHAAALAPQLARLTVVVAKGAEAPGLEVTRNGQPLGKPTWGTPAPVDPGPYSIRATAPGKKPWTSSVTLRASATEIVTIDALVDDAAPPSVAPVATASSPVATAPAGSAAPSETPPADAPRGQRTAGFVVGGAGIVAIGVGTYFLLKVKPKHDEALDHCPAAQCDASAADLNSQAKSYNTIGTITAITGAAMVIGGVALVLTAPSAKESARVAPVVGPGFAAAAFTGAFLGRGSLAARGRRRRVAVLPSPP